jgi:hypothetical protein
MNTRHCRCHPAATSGWSFKCVFIWYNKCTIGTTSLNVGRLLKYQYIVNCGTIALVGCWLHVQWKVPYICAFSLPFLLEMHEGYPERSGDQESTNIESSAFFSVTELVFGMEAIRNYVSMRFKHRRRMSLLLGCSWFQICRRSTGASRQTILRC